MGALNAPSLIKMKDFSMEEFIRHQQYSTSSYNLGTLKRREEANAVKENVIAFCTKEETGRCELER